MKSSCSNLRRNLFCFNPLVPDASERRDKLASLQNKQLEENQWKIGGFLYFASQE